MKNENLQRSMETAPFGTEELLVRIRTVLRSHRYSEKNESNHGVKFQFQNLMIDYDKRQRQKATGQYEKHQEENGRDTRRKALYCQ